MGYWDCAVEAKAKTCGTSNSYCRVCRNNMQEEEGQEGAFKKGMMAVQMSFYFSGGRGQLYLCKEHAHELGKKLIEEAKKI